MFKREVKGTIVFYSEDTDAKKQKSLGTGNKKEAQHLLAILNEAHQMPAMNTSIARTYFLAGDPRYATRTWQTVTSRASIAHSDDLEP